MNRVVDMNNPREKLVVLDGIRRLNGLHRIEIVKYRPRRSDRQNRYYWPCFVEPFADWLAGEWGEPVSSDEAHEILKMKFLKRPITNHDTGEVLELVRSTSTLSTAEFNQYLEDVAGFLAEFCGFAVPEPDVYREREEVPA